MKEEFELAINLLYEEWVKTHDKYHDDFNQVLTDKFPLFTFTWLPSENTIGQWVVTGGL